MEFLTSNYVFVIIVTCIVGLILGIALGKISNRISEILVYVFILIFPFIQFLIYMDFIPDILLLQTLAAELYFPGDINIAKITEDAFALLNVPYSFVLLASFALAAKRNELMYQM